MSRIFTYQDQAGQHFISEDTIIEEYFLFWSEQMKKVGKESCISKENCLEDWIVIHWAWEIK